MCVIHVLWWVFRQERKINDHNTFFWRLKAEKKEWKSGKCLNVLRLRKTCPFSTFKMAKLGHFQDIDSTFCRYIHRKLLFHRCSGIKVSNLCLLFLLILNVFQKSEIWEINSMALLNLHVMVKTIGSIFQTVLVIIPAHQFLLPRSAEHDVTLTSLTVYLSGSRKIIWPGCTKLMKGYARLGSDVFFPFWAKKRYVEAGRGSLLPGRWFTRRSPTQLPT